MPNALKSAGEEQSVGAWLESGASVLPRAFVGVLVLCWALVLRDLASAISPWAENTRKNLAVRLVDSGVFDVLGAQALGDTNSLETNPKLTPAV